MIIINNNAGLNPGGQELVKDLEGESYNIIEAEPPMDFPVTFGYLLPSGSKVHECLQEILEISPCLRPDIKIRLYFLCLGSDDATVKESVWTEDEMGDKIREIMEDYDRVRAIEGVI